MIALSTTREGELLICVILYLDKTWLTKSGQRTAKPLSSTLGNFPRAVYNTNAAKRLICQVPEFPCAKADIQKDKAARGSRVMYNDVIHQTLASFRQASQSGEHMFQSFQAVL